MKRQQRPTEILISPTKPIPRRRLESRGERLQADKKYTKQNFRDLFIHAIINVGGSRSSERQAKKLQTTTLREGVGLMA